MIKHFYKRTVRFFFYIQGFIPEVGFLAIVDSKKGGYSNLAIAYILTR